MLLRCLAAIIIELDVSFVAPAGNTTRVMRPRRLLLGRLPPCSPKNNVSGQMASQDHRIGHIPKYSFCNSSLLLPPLSNDTFRESSCTKQAGAF